MARNHEPLEVVDSSGLTDDDWAKNKPASAPSRELAIGDGGQALARSSDAGVEIGAINFASALTTQRSYAIEAALYGWPRFMGRRPLGAVTSLRIGVRIGVGLGAQRFSVRQTAKATALLVVAGLSWPAQAEMLA